MTAGHWALWETPGFAGGYLLLFGMGMEIGRSRSALRLQSLLMIAALVRARGYFVSTVGRDEEVIRAYIRDQEAEGQRLHQLQLLR